MRDNVPDRIFHLYYILINDGILSFSNQENCFLIQSCNFLSDIAQVRLQFPASCDSSWYQLEHFLIKKKEPKNFSFPEFFSTSLERIVTNKRIYCSFYSRLATNTVEVDSGFFNE